MILSFTLRKKIIYDPTTLNKLRKEIYRNEVLSEECWKVKKKHILFYLLQWVAHHSS